MMMSLTRSSGAGLCIGAVAVLSGVDALAKALGADLSSFQVAFMRYAVSAVFLAIFVIAFVRKWPKPGLMKNHAWRGFLAAATAGLFFYGLTGMPLLMALALAMTGPIYMAVLGVVILKEAPGRFLYAAILLAAVGAGLIVATRGTGIAGPPVAPLAIAAGLLAPLVYAFAAIAMKQSSASDHPVTLSLMQTIFAALFSAPLALVFWQVPAEGHAWQIVLIGLCGAVGFILLIAGLHRVPASLYAVIDYSALVWAGLFGFLFFDEIPAISTLFGAVLIVLACFLSAREQKGGP